jgi:hypothetical protein
VLEPGAIPDELVDEVDERVREAFDLGAAELGVINPVRRAAQVRRITLAILSDLGRRGALTLSGEAKRAAREARGEAIAEFRRVVTEHLEHRGQEAGPEGYHKVVSCLALVRVAISDYEQSAAAHEAQAL